MIRYKGNLLFTSHDHEIISTVANRVISFKNNEIIDRKMTYDEYLERFEREH